MKLGNPAIIKKGFIFLFLSCFLLVSCSNEGEEAKGEIDIMGNIVGINSSDQRILIKNKQEGLTWVTLHENGDIKDYEEGQDVAVWVEVGIDTTSTSPIKALNIEIINPKQ